MILYKYYIFIIFAKYFFKKKLRLQKMIRVLILGFCLIISDITTSQNHNEAIKFEASYIGDNVTNLSGGIKKGYSYLGLANLNVIFDTDKAGLWKGGIFFINASNTHGATPSANLIGDIQTASNIEAGNHTYLQELWYKQRFGNLEITAGLQDLNVEIANTEYGTTFLNSSFGIHPIISLNLHAPIFPLTSPGITTKWEINKNTCWLNAIYDGTPTDFEENPYNINWQFKPGDGTLFITEFQHHIKIQNRDGIIKVGAFAHNHIFERSFVKNFPDSLNTNTSGAYLNLEQQIWNFSGKNIGVFVQTGLSPSEISLNKMFLGAGIKNRNWEMKKQWNLCGKRRLLKIFLINPIFNTLYIRQGIKVI